jgi:hypothetical protein
LSRKRLDLAHTHRKVNFIAPALLLTSLLGHVLMAARELDADHAGQPSARANCKTISAFEETWREQFSSLYAFRFLRHAIRERAPLCRRF